jgi:hypothetical protein
MARAALATTFSSWAGTAGLTSTTALTPAIASSMLAGDADERVARMDEDLLVLLEPVIQEVPGVS